MARPTIAQARDNRLARRAERRALVAERNAARAAYRAAYRAERHTIASHLYALGVDARAATGMASALRKRLSGRGMSGFTRRSLAAGAPARRYRCTRYTLAQVVAALEGYRPHKEAYRAARAEAMTRAARALALAA